VIQAAADAVITGFVCAAAWWDVTTHRIPNTLTVTGLAAALMLRALVGVDAFTHGLTGACIAFVACLVLYVLRAVGGGDVKLLAGVGAFLGSSQILGALALIAVLGAAFALVTTLRRGVLPLLIFNTLDLVRSWLSFGKAGQRRKLDSPAALTIPYGAPIAMGTLIWWFGKGVSL
jgi:prepilin peptidase CpaA